jgi:hypothetical protein
MFSRDANFLRATARQLRMLAAGCFDWRDRAAGVSAAGLRDEEARKQMLVIAQGYDRLADRAENEAKRSPLFSNDNDI